MLPPSSRCGSTTGDGHGRAVLSESTPVIGGVVADPAPLPAPLPALPRPRAGELPATPPSPSNAVEALNALDAIDRAGPRPTVFRAILRHLHGWMVALPLDVVSMLLPLLWMDD